MTDTPVGLKIKTLRTLHGKFQTELAEQTGIYRPMLVAIESGQVVPGQEQINAINAAFGLDINSPEVEAAFDVLRPNVSVGENAA